jgi:uncharacterized membrane protein YagU involved in acid resistance
MTKFQTAAMKLMKSSDGGTKEKPSTVKVADFVSEQVTDHKVPRKRQNLAGNIVHYGFGTSMGILFGLLNDRRDEKHILSGIAFGAGVWLFADNVMLPLLGIAKSPFKIALKDHAYALSAHLVYGSALSRALTEEKHLIH